MEHAKAHGGASQQEHDARLRRVEAQPMCAPCQWERMSLAERQAAFAKDEKKGE